MKKIISLLIVLLVSSMGYSQSASAYYKHGIKKAEHQDYAGAIIDFSKAIELDPKFSSAYTQRGLSKNTSGDYKGASNDFSESIRILSNQADNLSAKAKLIFERLANQNQDSHYRATMDEQRRRLMDMQQANDYLTTSSETMQKAGRVYYYCGQAKSNLKEFILAIDDFNKAITYDPGYPCAYFERGQVWIELGEKTKAIGDYNKAIAYDSKYAMAYYNRGMTKISIGQNEDGCLDLKKASKLKLTKADNTIKENCH